MTDVNINPTSLVTNGAIVNNANPVPVYLVGGIVATAITVGTTLVGGGTTGRLLYDNGGTLGETSVFTFSGSTLTGTVGSITLTGGGALSQNGSNVTANGLRFNDGTAPRGYLIAEGSADGLFQWLVNAAGNAGVTVSVATADTISFRNKANSAGAAVIGGTYQSAVPAGSSAGLWKFGALQSGAVVLDTTRSIFVDIGGTVYKLMVAQ